MSSVIIRPMARRDLEHIWDYIARDNEQAAEKVYQQIKSEIRRLEDRPNAGHNRQDIPDRSYFFLNVGSYVVCYRIEAGTPVVVRVLHGRRDFGTLFSRRRRP
jgi:plasmid stabilization system protein ParE